MSVEAVKASVLGLVYRRPLPGWCYPVLHRVPLTRRALTLQREMGPLTARFLAETREGEEPPAGTLVKTDGRPAAPFRRAPVAARRAFPELALGWEGLERVLGSEPIRHRHGEPSGPTFVEWFEAPHNLIGRRLPDALARRVDWASCPFLEEFSPSIWSRAQGDVTQLHQDFCSAAEINLAGRKKWILFPPSQAELVYARLLKETGYREALVDPESETAARRFKRFAQAGPRIEVVTQPGDLLYVPAGWFHHVIYLERSFTMNFLNLTEELRNSDVSNCRGASHLMVVRGGALADVATG